MPKVPGRYRASGFDVHGAMHLPATGNDLWDVILKGRIELIDVRTLNFARVTEGHLLHESALP